MENYFVFNSQLSGLTLSWPALERSFDLGTKSGSIEAPLRFPSQVEGTFLPRKQDTRHITIMPLLSCNSNAFLKVLMPLMRWKSHHATRAVQRREAHLRRRSLLKMIPADGHEAAQLVVSPTTARAAALAKAAKAAAGGAAEEDDEEEEDGEAKEAQQRPNLHELIATPEHPAILEALENWWAMTLRYCCSDRAKVKAAWKANEGEYALTRADYRQLYTRLLDTFVGDDPDQRAAASEPDDWRRDTDGEGRLTHVQIPARNAPSLHPRLCLAWRQPSTFPTHCDRSSPILF